MAFFEIIEFLRLGGANQSMAFCIVKISVLSSTIIGLREMEMVKISLNMIYYWKS